MHRHQTVDVASWAAAFKQMIVAGDLSAWDKATAGFDPDVVDRHFKVFVLGTLGVMHDKQRAHDLREREQDLRLATHEGTIAALKETVAALTDTITTVQKAQPKYQEPWREGQRYDANSLVSYRGSAWIATADTDERPGDGPTAWRLLVKKGRDGRDAR